MFTRAFKDRDVIGFLMAHGVPYGPHLELANNRRNEAIRPIMAKWGPKAIADVKKMYGG
jgi:hypothetical protein